MEIREYKVMLAFLREMEKREQFQQRTEELLKAEWMEKLDI